MNLPLELKAAMLEITCREAVKLGEADTRIVDRRTLAGDGWQRVREWLRRGRSAPGPIAIMGDESIARAVREVVSSILPRPVAWAIAETTAFFGVGVNTVGWAAHSLPELPSPEWDRARLIGLSTTDQASICHEISHVWSSAPGVFEPPKMVDVAEAIREHEQAVLDAGNEMIDAFARHRIVLERIADDCASCWLGRPVQLGNRHVQWERERMARLAEPENRATKEKS